MRSTQFQPSASDLAVETSDHERLAVHAASMMSANADAARNAAEAQEDEDFSALEFEAWTHSPDEWTPPTNKEWAELANPHLVCVRLAWTIMFKTKSELIQSASELIEEPSDSEGSMLIDIIDRLGYTSDYLKALLQIVEGAQLRVMCAGMNVPHGHQSSIKSE